MADMHYRKTYSFGRKVRESTGRLRQKITGMAPCEGPQYCELLMDLGHLFRRAGALRVGGLNATQMAHARGRKALGKTLGKTMGWGDAVHAKSP